jgi:hypothetical protein
MTHEQQQPRFARGPSSGARDRRTSKRINAHRDRPGRRELREMFAAGCAGAPFPAMVFSRKCPVWAGLSRGGFVSRFVSLSRGRA